MFPEAELTQIKPGRVGVQCDGCGAPSKQKFRVIATQAVTRHRSFIQCSTCQADVLGRSPPFANQNTPLHVGQPIDVKLVNAETSDGEEIVSANF